MATQLKRFNLLPAQRRQRAASRLRRLLAVIVLGLLLTGLGAVSLQDWRELKAHRLEQRALTAELAHAEARVKTLQPHADRREQQAAMATCAAGILARRVAWSDFLQRLGVAIPDSVWLTNLSCMIPEESNPDTAPSASNATVQAAVAFTGKGFSHSDVSHFMTHLKQVPLLAEVRLKDSEQTSNETTSVPQPLDFGVEASLHIANPMDASSTEPVQ